MKKNNKNIMFDIDAKASELADITTSKYSRIPWDYAFDKVLSLIELDKDEVAVTPAEEVAEWVKDDWDYDLMSEDKLMERCSSNPLE